MSDPSYSWVNTISLEPAKSTDYNEIMVKRPSENALQMAGNCTKWTQHKGQ